MKEQSKWKWLGRILCVLIMLSGSLPSFSRDYLWSAYKSYEKSWNDVAKDSVPKFKNGVYEIKTPAQLAFISYVVAKSYSSQGKDFLKASFKLIADLDMSGRYWVPIGADDDGKRFSGTFDGNGHTIKNLYIYKEETSGPAGNNCGLFAAADGAFSIKNLVMYNWGIEGDKYVGLLVGVVKNAMNSTIDQVRCYKGHLSTHDKSYKSIGGLVGEVNCNSTLSITNSYVDCQIHDEKVCEAIGEFIGKIYKRNNVSFANCIAKTADNKLYRKETDSRYKFRGGFVGIANNASRVNFTQCGVEASDNDLDLINRAGAGCSIGLFVGALHCNNEGKADVTASDCFVMNSEKMRQMIYTNRNPNFFGKRSMGAVNVVDIHDVLTRKTDVERTIAVARMNKYRAHMGLAKDGSYLPLPSKDSCIVSMGVEKHVTKVSGPLASELCLAKNNEVFMKCGVKANYELNAIPHSWYMEDMTNAMTDKKRLGKYEFSGTPTSEVGSQLNFEVAQRPVITIAQPSYNVPRQRVELSWSVTVDDEVMSKYWKNNLAKTQWVIYRNGEKYDSLAIDKAYKWYDETPLVGQDVVYQVYLISPYYFYDKDDNIVNGDGIVSCGKDIALDCEVSQTGTGVSCKIKLPNSKAFDGCTASLWKIVINVDGTKNAPVLVDGSSATYHYKGASQDDYLDLTLLDKTTESACARWGYYVQCDNFQEGSAFNGQVINSTTKYITPISDPIVIEKFWASKGESANKINVEWKTKKLKEATLYSLYRKLYDVKEANEETDNLDGWDLVTELTNSYTTNSYVDEVLPGYVYKYRLRAYKPCDGSYAREVPAKDTLTVGYAASRGTIMGRITYGTSSTVVSGVDVRIGSDASAMQSVGNTYAFLFGGGEDQMQLVSGLKDKFWKGDWTLQFLFRPSRTEEMARLLTIPGHCAVLSKSDTLYFNGEAMTLPSAYNYNYVMLKHEKGVYSLGYALADKYDNWLVQVKDADMTAWMKSQTGTFTGDGIYFGKVDDKQKSFSGHLDEVRLWKKGLTATDVRNTYNRYLTGNESKLEAYYTFDAGVAEFAFDNSHPGGIWNNHDTKILKVGAPKLVDILVPDQSILCYRGFTDDNGEYQIAGIPFVGEGTNYMVTPVYGTHEFQPASTRRYVSAQSLSHSDVDFSDKSSFRVPVKATYVYGNIPVEGLGILVDGVAQTDANYQPITTDENGEAVVNVPIGKHRLQLSGVKHQMMNKGYACSVTTYGVNGEVSYKSLPDAEGYYDFQNDLVAPMTFVDSTLVRLVGRVAGGFEEAGKPVGFHQGIANLGAMELRMSPMGGKTAAAFVYTKADGVVGPTDEVQLASNAGDTIATKTTYPFNERYIKVQTDPKTGEYLAMLPPIAWKVTQVRSVAKPEEIPFNMENMNNIVTLDLSKEQADTLYKDTLVMDVTRKVALGKPFKYCGKKNYIQYHEPKLIFTTPKEYLSNERDSLMLGTSYFDRSYGKEVDGEYRTVVERVPLWKDGVHDGTKNAYVLGYPVFETGCEYAIDLFMSEEYTNYTTGEVTRIPIRGALVTIDNKMASTYFKPIKTGGYEVVDTLGTKTDGVSTKAGYVNYTFTAGLPNLTEADHAWPMNVKYTINEIDYTLNTPIKGICLGAIPRSGSNFVTAGPNMVDFVLRDPPGSNSTAYLERGSTMSASYTLSQTTDGKRTMGEYIEPGTLVKTAVIASGIKIEEILTSKKSSGTDAIETLTGKEGYSHSWNVSYTLTDKITTSSNAKYVGAMGDVYIGTSHNYILAIADALHLYPADDGKAVTKDGQHFTIMRKEVNSISDSIATVFQYAQYDIVNTVIPNLKDKRNSLVTFWVDDFSKVAETTPGKEYVYYALNSSKNKDIWKENVDYKSVTPKNSGKGAQDMVLAYSQWIENWEQRIAEEEKKKYTAFNDMETKHFTGNATQTTVGLDYGYLGNVTFSSGSSYSKSFKVSEASTGSTDISAGVSGTTKYSTKSSTEGAGETFVFNTLTETNVTEVVNRKASDTENQTTTFGFNMADGDVGDDFSVSLYLPGKEQSRQTTYLHKLFMPEPYMFFTKGGQSRNPWEKTQMSLYYKVNGQSVPLDGGTESMDQPYIKFDNANIFNVPTGTVASATMTVANNSKCNTAEKNFIYTLRCLNINEKDGLQVLVNGQPVTNGILIKLPPNGTPKKYQVDFKQTKVDVANYDDLLFELRLAQSVETATDKISIHFEPRAPKPTLKVNGGENVVNKNSVGQRLLFNLSGYSQDYYLFGGIRLKYRKQGTVLWNTQKTLVNDEQLLIDNGKMPDNNWRKLVNKADTINFDMSKLLDGKYEVCAEAFSVAGIGKDDLVAISDTAVIVKDTQAPDCFGKLKPAGGYYDGSQEIGVTFTEPINEDYLNNDNFVVKAILNEAEITHKTGLHFDGPQTARTNTQVALTGQNTTLAFWYKPITGKKSCLFSQTTKNKGNDIMVALYYNEDASLTLKVGDKEYSSGDKKAVASGKPFDDWMYAVVTFDREKDKILVHNLYSTVTGDEALFIMADKNNNLLSTNKGYLYVGGSVNKEESYADMEGMVLYGSAMNLSAVAANKDKTISNTRGILSYWPMTEGYGAIAKDKVRRCDLVLSGSDNWYIPTTNYALQLNGKNQYVNIKTESCPVAKDEDYTLEFWFRANEQATKPMTLFSNGWGAAESKEREKDKANRLSISLNEQGRILLSAAGATYQMGNKRYDDQNWHCLSMNVQRDAYLTLMVDTVELANNQVVLGSNLGGFENNKMTIGALRYTDATTQKEEVDNYFNGEIDEVRIWNAHRTDRVVNQFITKRLYGNEPGLVAYYPFELTEIVANQEKTSPSVTDHVIGNVHAGIYRAQTPEYLGFSTVASDTTALAKEITCAFGPRIPSASVMSPIDMNYKLSSDKTTLLLDFPSVLAKSRIEGCNVNISLRNLEDLNGNRMQQPLEWSVYVNQADLVAYLSESSLQQQVGESASTKLSLYNAKSASNGWMVTNIPSWLKLSKTEGKLEPLGSADILVEVLPGTPIGSYQESISIIDGDEISYTLPVELTVTGIRPNWMVDVADNDNWMGIVGRLKIEDRFVSNENDLVAAFDAKGLCHGIASPKYDETMDTYFLQMNILGGNLTSQDKLYFRVWDATSGLVYPDVVYQYGNTTGTALSFVNNKVMGNFNNLFVLNAKEQVRQLISLEKGWTWMSTWIKPEAEDGYTYNKVFGAIDDKIQVVKPRFLPASTKGDYHNITLKPSESYHVSVTEPCKVELVGHVLNPEDIAINFSKVAIDSVRWYWIGYPVRKVMTLDEAFAELVPAKGDVVKSQKAFSMYNGKTWVGNLTYLSPGEGYMYGYHAQRNQEWHYPSNANDVVEGENVTQARSASVVVQKKSVFRNNPSLYASNMTLVGKLEVDGSPAVDYRVGAFVDGECRGWASSDSDGSVYLTIGGDDANKRITYRAYNPETGSLLAIRQSDTFSLDAIVGSSDKPRTLTASSAEYFSLEIDPEYYEDYSYVKATVLKADGQLYDSDYELAAFNQGGKCCGVSTAHAKENCMMAIYGNADDSFTFKLWNKASATVIPLDGKVVFDASTPVIPVTLRILTTGINGVNADDAIGKAKLYDINGVKYEHMTKRNGTIYVKDNKKVSVK